MLPPEPMLPLWAQILIAAVGLLLIWSGVRSSVRQTLSAARWYHLNDGVSRLRALWLAVWL
jgi:hypothetical protein